MKLSRTVVYAIQATMQLAQSGSQQPVPCSQLAAEGHMPERFLLQILRHLVTHGILHSTRGVEGGYTLERKPDDVSLLDIMEALEGPLISTVPPVDGAAAELFQGRLREALDDITNSARRQLAEIKLADLLPLAASSPAAESATEAT
jgi:Rrf2 family protein